MSATLGWDIGGVNTKVARVAGGSILAVESCPFELQLDPGAFVETLRSLAAKTGARGDEVHAVTMTAELSQMFRTKRDGVAFVLDAVEAAFPGSTIRVYAVNGRFLSVAEAVTAPLLVAAANWAATARVVSKYVADALIVDVGTTTADVIPIVGGHVAAEGWTDPDRLASGELVYSGAVRTPVEALSAFVPFRGGEAGVSAEGFALSGDVHVWRGDLQPVDYTAPTPDRRPVTREFVGERLARAICADREMLDEPAVTEIADALASAQVERIVAAIVKVRGRHPSLRTAVVTGLGAFIAERAAHQAGMRVVPLAAMLGDAPARCAPAASVALLLDAALLDSRVDPRRLKPALYVVDRGPVDRRAGPSASADTVSRGSEASPSAVTGRTGVVDTVVKIGGGLLAHRGQLETVLEVLSGIARNIPLLIVPGGGPFADAVRAEDERLRLSDDAAHWMAVLAMDQYAHLIASRLPGSVIVSEADAIAAAVRAGSLPVLAPSTWLRRADPLPHSWQVTSDTIAAWVAWALGARMLLLVKPPHAAGPDMVDPYFERTLGDLPVRVVTADSIETLGLTTRP
jgi:hypothetical protein